MENTPLQSPPAIGRFALFWLRIGCISFGGPAAHIALMHQEVVERRRWIDDAQFSRALGFCMLLPGPEAQQLAAYIGWRLHGVRGALVAGGLFVLPAALLLWVLSVLYTLGGSLPAVRMIFEGVQPVVIALVAGAAMRLAKRSVHAWPGAAVAVLAFAALAIFRAPYPLVIAGALAIGALAVKSFAPTREEPAAEPGRGAANALRAGLWTLAAWLLPVAAIAAFLPGTRLASTAVFFSTTSVLTFGGAYAILPFVAQHAAAHGWITAAEMVDGVGLAEITPGPLIIVLQFVAFLAGRSDPGALNPLLAGTAASVIAVWTTFVPSFAWIFFGAPHIERLRHIRRLSSAMNALSAAITGIVAHLAVWMAAHVLVMDGTRLDFFAIAMAGAAFALRRFGIFPLLLVGGLAGVVRGLFFG